jgi:hypothetical protein
MKDAQLGFLPDRLVTVHQPNALANSAALQANQILDRLRHLPGVSGAAHGSSPLSPGVVLVSVWIGRPPTYDEIESSTRHVRQSTVSAEYFDTVGIPLLEGRTFDPTVDRPGSAVVTRTLAQLLDPNNSVVGRPIFINGTAGATVVGVTGDVWADGPDRPPPPMLYRLGSAPGAFVVRTKGEPQISIPSLRAVVTDVTQDKGPLRIVLESALRDQITALHRSRATLLVVVAGLGLGLCAVVVSASVNRSIRNRRRELAIRLAIGAQRTEIVYRVMRQMLLPAALGIAFGAVGGIAAGNVIASTLFRTDPLDWPTFAGGTAVLLGTAGMSAISESVRFFGTYTGAMFRDD